jgi:ribosomal protein L11 methyltransferase
MKAKPLWRLSIETTAEAEEAVGELLAVHFANAPSAYINAETKRATVSVYCESRKEWSPMVARSLAEGLARTRECGLDIGSAKISFQRVRREDWAESWKRHFKPIAINSTLLIKPSWSKQKPKRGQAVVVLDPGLSFGTGQHATTRYCLQQLAGMRRRGMRQSFLDIGTGSGILAIAAVKLGFSPVEAFDFDPEAIRVAQANARKNRVRHRLSLTRKDVTKLPLKSNRQYDLICANLIFDLLIAEAGRIIKRLEPTGRLALAGILTSQFAGVERAFVKLGLRCLHTQVEGEWQSGTFAFAQPV